MGYIIDDFIEMPIESGGETLDFGYDEDEAYKNLFEWVSESDDEDDKAFYRYLLKFGKSERIGLCIPDGYPRGVEERGGPINVYNECIEKGVRWEELLNYDNSFWKDNPDIVL